MSWPNFWVKTTCIFLIVKLIAILIQINSKRCCMPKTGTYTSKKTFRGANQVISYLGRYTHRVAISNSRILACNDDRVCFRCKDYRDNKQKTMTLPVREFTARFLKHILPDNFYKIRYYGIMASCGGTSKMDLCLKLLGKPLIRSPLERLAT